MRIEFNQPLVIPDQNLLKRSLKSITDLQDIIRITVTPENEDPHEMSPEIVEWKEDYLLVNLNFEEPL